MPVREGHLPEFESDQHAEWRIRNGDALVLRYDRKSGEWAGEREELDPERASSRSRHRRCS
jgi:hypothetical protein